MNDSNIAASRSGNTIRIAAVPLLAAAIACSACASLHPKSLPASADPAPVAQSKPAPAAPAAAAVPAPAAPPVAMPAGKTHKLHGVVASVDAASGALTVNDRQGRTRTLRVAAGATLTKGGDRAAIALADVASGDHVTLDVAGDVAAGLHVNVLTATP